MNRNENSPQSQGITSVQEADLPPIPPERRIFVNRNLRMMSINAVGFDMDYTLAMYIEPAFDLLCAGKTIERMVALKGYPDWLFDLDIINSGLQRGLVVDRETGNILKMDRYNHVWKANRGREPVPQSEVIDLYRKRSVNFGSERFVWMDSLFSVVDLSIFSASLDVRKEHPLWCDVKPRQLFDDIHECVDIVHGDGSIKSVVAADPALFIHKDPALAVTLHKLRSSGKRLFLLTNSHWIYTNAVMSFLLNGDMREYPSWMSYFDFIVVGAGKPGFFTAARPFYEVDTRSDKDDALLQHKEGFTALERGHVYQGGNKRDFEKMTGLSGDEVLYVGDNIYGDILQSKVSSRWRTAMIVPELEHELVAARSMKVELAGLVSLETERIATETRLNRLRIAIGSMEEGVEDPQSRNTLKAYHHSLETTRKYLKQTIAKASELETLIENRYNPVWGSLFREKNEITKFGSQLEEYACIYTSRVTNFIYYSPAFYYFSPRDYLPHEID